MATGALGGVIGRIRTVALGRDGTALSDSQLLECFITRRQHAAFEALVRRHGPMVLGVCRRVLRHEADAEDAFQATFLVLARRAASLRQRELVGNWLYGTAYRAALHAKAARRRLKEKQVSVMPERAMPQREGVDAADHWSELRPLLDEALTRLPDKYRAAVVLCDLEGRPRREVARQLGIPVGTLSGRLTTARRALAKRLARHHLAVSAGALASMLSGQSASACPPTALVTSTTKAALQVAGGCAAAAVVSTKVAAITEGVLTTMLLSKLKVATAALLVALASVLGVASFAGRPALAQPAGPKEIGASAGAKDGAEADTAWAVARTLEGHKDRVESVAFSKNSKHLATASYDGTAKLWDVVSGKHLATLEGHEGPINRVVFSPDGKLLATAGEDKTVRVWDVAVKQTVQKLQHNTPVYSVVFTTDSKLLVAAGGIHDASGNKNEGELKIWDPASGREIHALAGHNERIYYLAFTSDGKTLVTAAGDNSFKTWDWDGKNQLSERLAVGVGQRQGVYGLAVSPDGKTIAVTTDATIKLYDLATGNERDELEKRLGSWDQVSFSPDSKVVVANSWRQERDGKFIVQRRSVVRFWDVASGKVRQTVEIKSVVESVAFAPDGKTVAAGCRGHCKVPDSRGGINPDDIEETKEGPVHLLRLKGRQAEKK